MCSGVITLKHPPFTSRRFLVFISVRGSVDLKNNIAGRIRRTEKSSDLIGN
jgi:hypothetical protein